MFTRPSTVESDCLMGLFDRLKQGLQKTTKLLKTDVRDLFKSGEILTDEHISQFERRLIESDMGVKAAGEIVTELRDKHRGRTVDVEAIWETVRQKLQSLLEGEGNTQTFDAQNPLSPLNLKQDGPTVILVAGVNGVGKTTSIAKLAKLIHDSGKKVVLAAADTFRAAAVEQLTLWSQRIGCQIVTRPAGTDPASVAYTGCEVALAEKADVLIIDTAGRLQTQKNLMQELEKIFRVIQKQIPDAPHERLLVLDATTGQNGISQATNFTEAIDSTGLILAKLDGTAKGGVVVAIRQKMGIPVKFVGTGEQIDDLQVFDPVSFAQALVAE